MRGRQMCREYLYPGRTAGRLSRRKSAAPTATTAMPQGTIRAFLVGGSCSPSAGKKRAG